MRTHSLKADVYISMSYICEYCDRAFSEKTNLNRHQKHAKYCLKLQGVRQQSQRRHVCDCGQEFTRPDNLQRHRVKCKGFYCGCGKSFTRKSNLQRHQIGCTEKPPNEAPVVEQSRWETQNDGLHKVIQSYENLVKSLQKQITEVGNISNPVPTGPGGNNNRNVVLQNMQPLSDQEIQEQLEHLTLGFITEGGKGYADFANHYSFQDKVLCTDRSRKKFKYKNPDGEIITDSGGAKLTQKFFQLIAPRNEELINREYTALQREVQQIAIEGRAHSADLTGLLTKATSLQTQLFNCQEAAKGQTNDLTVDFMNHLSKML